MQAPTSMTVQSALERSARYRLLALLLEPSRPGRLEEARALVLEWQSRDGGVEGANPSPPEGERGRGEGGDGKANAESGMTNEEGDQRGEPLAPRRGERGRGEGEAASRSLHLEDVLPLLNQTDAEAAAEEFRTFGPAGPVSRFASDFIEGGFSDKGPILADIAGFYRAFGFTPLAEEPPDHFSSMLSFVSFLALKQAYALHSGLDEEAAIARDAEKKFLTTHLTGPLARFAERLREVSPLGKLLVAIQPDSLMAAAPAPRHSDV